VDDAAGRYIEFCKSTFPSSLDLRGIKLVVDCAHGATYHVAPHVFHELGADVTAIGVKPDGFNINDLSGATYPQALQAAVKENKADVGVAFDGDGDRLLMVDGDGTIYDGDQLLYAIARERARHGPLAGVVGTLMTNLAFEVALEKMGVAFVRARVGDRYVLEMLQARHWHLGGENSGHIICLDKHTTGDGIVSALQVLSALITSRSTLAKLCKALQLYPQKLINVPVPKGFNWEKKTAVAKAKREAERSLGKAGRVLLRMSGTEPVLRVMVEGKEKDQVQLLASKIADAVKDAA